MSLLSALPAPRLAPPPAAAPPPDVTTVAISGAAARLCTAPPFGQRRGFVPRKPSDFGDGGAYPECHVAQYPLARPARPLHDRVAAV